MFVVGRGSLAAHDVGSFASFSADSASVQEGKVVLVCDTNGCRVLHLERKSSVSSSRGSLVSVLSLSRVLDPATGVGCQFGNAKFLHATSVLQ